MFPRVEVMPGGSGAIGVEHSGELFVLKFNVVLYLCPRDGIGAEGVWRSRGGNRRVVQSEVASEEFERLANDAGRLAASERDGVEMDVHFSRRGIVLFGEDGNGMCYDRRLISDLS